MPKNSHTRWTLRFDRWALLFGVCVFSACCATSFIAYTQQIGELNTNVRAKLGRLADLAAALTDVDAHQSVKTPQQEQDPVYARLVAPFIQILKTHDDIVYIYTVRPCGPRLCFVIDADAPKSGEKVVHSHVLEVYKNPPPALKQALAGGRTIVQTEAYTDEYGDLISAYAPLYSKQNKVVGVVGVDMTYKRYQQKGAAILRAHLVALAFGGLFSLALAIWIHWLRTHNERLRERFKSIIAHAPAVLFECQLDEGFTVNFINDQIEPLTGFPTGAFSGPEGRGLMSLLAEEERRAVRAKISAQLQHADRFVVEMRIVTRPQREGLGPKKIWVRMSGAVAAANGAQGPTVLGYLQDINASKIAESKLIDNERYFRTLADSLPNLLWIANRHGDSIFFNTTWLDYIGRDLNDQMERGWLDNIHPDDKPVCERKFQDAVANAEAFECWFRLRRRDGEYRWMLCWCRPRLSADGKCDGFVGAATDITERKEFEARIKRSNQHLELFFKHTPAAIAVFDDQMRYLMVSERFRFDYHLDDQDLIGRSHYDVFPELPGRWKDVHWRCLNGEVLSSVEDIYERPDGEREWIKWEAHPWYEDGVVKGVIMFTELISERKKLDDELRQHRDHLQALVDGQTQKIRKESDENVLLRNIITTANYADTVERAIKRCIDEVCLYTGWALGHCYLFDAQRRLMRSAGVWSDRAAVFYPELTRWIGETPMLMTETACLPVIVANRGASTCLNLKDWEAHGPRAPLLLGAGLHGMIGLPIRAEGRILGVFEFFSPEEMAPDENTLALLENIGLHIGRIIDRFTQEENLKIAKTLAEDSTRAKSEFLSNMSHELRTPMHAILNYASMGAKRMAHAAPGEDAEKVTKYLNNIQRAGDRLLELLNNLLDLAKMESGKMSYEFQRDSLRSVVEATEMELSSLLQAKNIKLETTYSAQNLTAVCDHKRLMQVSVNLFSNAIKFAPENSTLHLEIRQADEPVTETAALEFRLRDEGPGVPTGELERIFENFVQSSETKSGAGGAGLGLSICKQIIDAHGGRIWAENAAPQGAVFCFTLPQNLKPAAARGPEPHPLLAAAKVA